jgi:hypothetical protein
MNNKNSQRKIGQITQRPFIPPEYLKLFQKNFNILDSISMSYYCLDQQALRDKLTSLHKASYDSRDRIIVYHWDSDYYIQNRLGLNLINFFNTWRDLDIPFHVMLFYTNHIGISQEISAICEANHPADRPCVIETVVANSTHIPEMYLNEPDLQEDQIQHHALCLLGGHQRTHRFALYNHLQSLSEKIAITLKGKQ